MVRLRARYVVLSVLFGVAVLYQGRAAVDNVRLLFHASEIAAPPFWLSAESAVVHRASRHAAEAGLRPGDRLLGVNGRPYTGSIVLAETLARLRPGDPLTVKVRRAEKGAPPRELTLTLRVSAASGGVIGPGEFVLIAEFGLIMPVFCIALGFWVAAVRVWDPLAWLVLGVMLSFANLNNAEIAAWAPGLRGVALAYHALCQFLWPVWILLFALFFPDTLPLERRRPWLKWILIGPLALFSLASVVVMVGGLSHVDPVEPLARLLDRAETGFGIATVLAGAAFLLSLYARRRMEASPDSRRRLRLLLAGSTLAFAPELLLGVARLAHGGEMGRAFPFWLVMLAVLPVVLFPLTLAYVIVVQRAMDVRVALRQGVRYALARGGIRLLQSVTGAAIVWGVIELFRLSGGNWPASIALVGVGSALIFSMRRLGQKLAAWTDRRFFREAYNTEQILTELSANVRTVVETRPLLEMVARRISESLHVPQVAFLLNGSGAYRPAYALGYAATPPVSFAGNAATVKHLARKKEPVAVYFDDRNSWVHREQEMSAEEREMLRALGPELLLPLSLQERLLGFIALGRKRSEEPYSRTDLALLQSVASQTGLALENSRLTATVAAEAAERERLNRELEIAREVQERLFPQRLPAVPGLDYAGRCRTALEVGGDYYDFLALPDGGFAFVVADVSGKGIAAALLVAGLQAWLRSQIMAHPANLAAVMESVNRHLYESSSLNHYATLFLARYEPATRVLEYANAGHNAPILLRGDEVLRLEAGGLVAGAFPVAACETARLALLSGDLLVAFTDGVVEALNVDEEEWGEQRLIATLRDCAGLKSSEVIDCVLSGAEAFASGTQQYDDMTLVAARAL